MTFGASGQSLTGGLLSGVDVRPEPSSLPRCVSGRSFSLELFQAAVAGAATGPVTQRAIEALDIDRDRRIWLLAFGKAAPAMTAAAAAALQRSLRQIVGGILVSTGDGGVSSPYATVTAVRGDHPIPGRHSFAAAARIGELTAGRRSSDVVIVLVSGGTSSLIAAPLRGMGESDLSHLYEMLLGSGLDIGAMNAVRKRFSRWAAGRLALALAPSVTLCFAVSDVPGDDPSTIGSGPCSPDPCTVDQVTDILQRSKLLQRLPASFRDHLTGTKRGIVPETPKERHPAFAHVTTRVIATNRHALNAAATRARELGARAVDVMPAPLTGEAWARGEQLARELLALRSRVTPGTGPVCRIWGGETTVTLNSSGDGRGWASLSSDSPSGGRCQELALAAARILGSAGDAAAGITLFAAGTDGRDGSTDAAGACVDADSWRAIVAQRVDADRALTQHESYRALDAAGALVKTGPTGTNVMDIVIGTVD